VTFYAKWTLNNYTITWDANGGNGGGENSCDHGVMPTAIDAGTKTGYAFAGWNPVLAEATGDTTYTAQWDANAVNITFDANGGTGGTGPTAMAYDSPLTAPTVTKEGFVLAGWNPELPATVPLTDTTYVAQWETTVVTVTMVGSEFKVNIEGWAADYQYQIWSYQNVTSDILLGDDGNVQANQWILSQGYTPGSAGTPDASNNGSINFMIPGFTSPTENFMIAVRIADANGNFVTEIRDAYTPEALSMVVITKVLVDDAVTTGYELREIKAGAETLIKVIGNDVPGIVYTATVRQTGDNLDVSNTNEFLWDISALAPGIYTIEITATNGDTTATKEITFELFTLAGTTTYGSIDEMSLDLAPGGVDITPIYANGTFSFRVREPGRAAQFRSVEYANAGTVTHPITAPGVYHVFGYATRAGLIGTEGSYDDGLIRTLVIPRDGGSSSASLNFTANQTLPNVANGTPIVFTATATGLPGTVQYSFWRYDATGYVLVKDWSTSNTFSWTPARLGEYQLEARAKGDGAGSYELKTSLGVNITDQNFAKADVTTITLNTG
ncbi:MAG: hypothetical protein GXZ02_11895, partial [Clostridiales bacterium]|nr:hypothetical protein [Clostridiales bacterium]